MEFKDIFTIRINVRIHEKVKKIAEVENKAINQKYEEFIAQAISEYEKIHGKIDYQNYVDFKEVYK